MPDWLEIIFACLSAFSVACSLFLLWETKYKNRISRKTLKLQEVIFGDAKYSYDEHDYLKPFRLNLFYTILPKNLFCYHHAKLLIILFVNGE